MNRRPARSFGMNIIVALSPGWLLPRHVAQKSLPLSRTLPNGLNVVHLPMTSDNTFAAALIVHAGSLEEESDADSGMAHLLEHVLAMGSRRRRSLLRIGLPVSATTEFDRMSLIGSGQERQLGRVLHALAEMAYRPNWSTSRLERERNAVLAEFTQFNTLDYRIAAAQLSSVHAETLLATRPPVGAVASIRAINIERLQHFHHEHYVPERSSLFIVGGRAGRTNRLVNLAFGQLPPASASRVRRQASRDPASRWSKSQLQHAWRVPARAAGSAVQPQVHVHRHAGLVSGELIISLASKWPLRRAVTLQAAAEATMAEAALEAWQGARLTEVIAIGVLNKRLDARSGLSRDLEMSFEMNDEPTCRCTVSTLAVRVRGWSAPWPRELASALATVSAALCDPIDAADVDGMLDHVLRESAARAYGALDASELLDSLVYADAIGAPLWSPADSHRALVGASSTLNAADVQEVLSTSLLPMLRPAGATRARAPRTDVVVIHAGLQAAEKGPQVIGSSDADLVALVREVLSKATQETVPAKLRARPSSAISNTGSLSSSSDAVEVIDGPATENANELRAKAASAWARSHPGVAFTGWEAALRPAPQEGQSKGRWRGGGSSGVHLSHGVLASGIRVRVLAVGASELSSFRISARVGIRSAIAKDVSIECAKAKDDSGSDAWAALSVCALLLHTALSPQLRAEMRRLGVVVGRARLIGGEEAFAMTEALVIDIHVPPTVASVSVAMRALRAMLLPTPRLFAPSNFRRAVEQACDDERVAAMDAIAVANRALLAQPSMEITMAQRIAALQRLSPEVVAAAAGRCLHPGRVVVSGVGSLASASLRTSLETSLVDWLGTIVSDVEDTKLSTPWPLPAPSRPSHVSALREAPTTLRIAVRDTDEDRAVVRIAGALLSEDAEAMRAQTTAARSAAVLRRWAAFEALERIFNARLFSQLREARGIVYQAALNISPGHAHYTIEFTTAPQHAEAAVRAAIDEIVALATGVRPPTRREVQVARTGLAAACETRRRDIEWCAAMVTSVASDEVAAALAGGSAYPRIIRKLSCADVSDLATQMVTHGPDLRVVIVAAG